MIYWAKHSAQPDDGEMIERHRLSREDLSAMIGVEGYSDAAIRAVLDEYGAGGLHEWLWIDTEKADAAFVRSILSTTGKPPWSIGNDSGLATGWPLTDWFEDILLRSAGPQTYDDLITHDIPWTHPQVLSAALYFGDILGNEAYQLGGKSGTLNTFFGDAFHFPFCFPERRFLSDWPLSSSRCALWTSRSMIESAMVGSPM